MVLKGTYGTAVVYSDSVDQGAIDQIKTLLEQPMTKGANVRIMPDVHAGAGCVIGYTARVTDTIVPNLIGVDIGCGVLAIRLHEHEKITDLQALDSIARTQVPLGFSIHRKAIYEKELSRVKETCRATKQDYERVMRSIGTLGGGNHFIELALDDEENQWLIVHSGSRNFGLKVAQFYQTMATKLHPEAPKSLAWLEGDALNLYLRDMKVAQNYAQLNRKVIVNSILQAVIGTHYENDSHLKVESIHNYIDFNDNIIRKGAISAALDEPVIIPFNMRDGSILGYGKGNKAWNFSAPHGAGRLMSRTQAKNKLSLSQFKAEMAGVYSTSVNKSTLDEAPMAYKNAQEIIGYLEPTVEVGSMLKPIWNLKG